MARYSEVLIPDTQPYRLENASIPRVCIAGAPGNAVADSEGCLRVDLVIDDGRVAALAPYEDHDMVDTLRQAVRVTGEIALPTRGLGRRVVDKYLARRQYLLTHRPKF